MFLIFTNTLAIKNKYTERYLIVKRPIKLPDFLQETDSFEVLQVQSLTKTFFFQNWNRGKIPTQTK